MDLVLKLKLDDKEYDARIIDADKQLGELRKKSEEFSDSASKWAQMATGFNQALEASGKIFNALKQVMTEGSMLGVLRREFKGSADDLELFRVATSRTVTEGNLIKLSNQASDLGVTLQEQAILFALADNAADRYGTTIETGFMQVINATEGSERGIKSIGIQTKLYKEIVDRMAQAHGDTIEKLDAETQKRIRLKAIIEASGLTIDQVKEKVQDNNDKIEALNVSVDEAREKMGLWLSEQLVPLIDLLGKSEKGTFGLRDAVVALTGSLPQLLIGLSGLKYLLPAGSLAAFGKTAGPLSIGLLAGLGAGKGIDWIKDNYGNPNGGYDWDKINRAVDIFGVGSGDIQGTDLLETTKPMAPKAGEYFIPGQGVFNFNTPPKKIESLTKEQLAAIKKANEEKLKEQEEFNKKLIKLEEDYVDWLDSIVASSPMLTSQETVASTKGGVGWDASYRYTGSGRPTATSKGGVSSAGYSREYQEQIKEDAIRFGNTMVNIFDGVWNKIISGSISATDIMDSIFSSLLQSLGDYLSDIIMQQATSSIFDAIFSVGGAVAGVPVGKTIIPVNQNSDLRAERLLGAYLDRIDKWQTELSLQTEVKNDSIYLSYNKADKIRKANEM